MPKHYHTVTCPNGQILTRNSLNRVYTHAVVARPSLAYAEAGPFTPHGYRTEQSVRNEYQRYLTLDPKTNSPWLEKELSGIASEDEYVERCVRTHLKLVEERKTSGTFEKYFSLGWNGRLDLAHKVKASNTGPNYDEVLILEATMVYK